MAVVSSSPSSPLKKTGTVLKGHGFEPCRKYHKMNWGFSP